MHHILSRLVPQSVKNSLYHRPLAIIAAVCFGFPGRRLRVIGITGTNGKTTTTQFIARILEQSNKKVAMASTINFQIGEKKWTNASKFTTLSPWKLQKFLHDAVAAGCEYAVIETSSHALDQGRVSGIPYEIAVMTNVTREHLDYHQTMAAYRRAKRQLFERARMAVVNLDMEEPEEYLSARRFEKQLSYGIEHGTADLVATDIEETLSGSTFRVRGIACSLHLPGRYNIENALAALGMAELLGIDLGQAAAALGEIAGVPGRMESVPNTRGISIIIDYAVTPDSLEKLYALIARMRLEDKKIIAIFGACGERDRGKRPIMGAIVSAQADIVILTNEDPYHEDPERIIDEIEQGIVGKEKEKDWFRIFDRRAAIARALSLAGPGDIVVITGKGAEETMAQGDERLPWSERTVILEELGKMR